ncbi:MAG: hypothetical protein KF678_08225 [Phycisphaeraceae bacterium]|nr:hypothetical protein [Phycisphaeraceae bacterium]
MSEPPTSSTPEPSGAIPPEVLKQAFTAFKKRLKLTKLNDESKLGGHRPTTSGKKSDVMGIIPPSQFGVEVWEALAAQGKIKRMGGGFYSMP